MSGTLHLTSGDCAGERLAASGIPGEVFVWHDILYDGPRNPGWPDEDTLQARARFLEETTAEAATVEECARFEPVQDQARPSLIFV